MLLGSNMKTILTDIMKIINFSFAMEHEIYSLGAWKAQWLYG